MAKLKKHLSTEFTHLPNATLQDERLSFTARGILAYAISLPDDWQFDAKRVARACEGQGIQAVSNAFKELELCGYRWLEKKQVNGKWYSEAHFSDMPIPEWAARAPEDQAKRSGKAKDHFTPETARAGSGSQKTGISVPKEIKHTKKIQIPPPPSTEPTEESSPPELADEDTPDLPALDDGGDSSGGGGEFQKNDEGISQSHIETSTQLLLSSRVDTTGGVKMKSMSAREATELINRVARALGDGADFQLLSEALTASVDAETRHPYHAVSARLNKFATIEENPFANVTSDDLPVTRYEGTTPDTRTAAVVRGPATGKTKTMLYADAERTISDLDAKTYLTENRRLMRMSVTDLEIYLGY